MHGVFLDRGSVDAGDLEFSALDAALESWTYFDATPQSSMSDRLAEAQVAVINKLSVTDRILRACPNLQLICVAATGYDAVDLSACESHGVAVYNARDYATPSVVQHVFALILSLATRQPDYSRAACDGTWSQHPHFALLQPGTTELSGKTLGVIGLGTLGSAVADVGGAFGMRLVTLLRPGRAPRETDRSLDDLLREADVVSLHCPLNDQTRHLIGAQELRALGRNGLMINASRGGLVDEIALVDAVRQGVIAGAGVDVLTEEPPGLDHPLIATELPNLIVTPHSAWAAREARQRLVDQVAENIRDFRSGVDGRRLRP